MQLKTACTLRELNSFEDPAPIRLDPKPYNPKTPKP